jgi:hypothetical protein
MSKYSKVYRHMRDIIFHYEKIACLEQHIEYCQNSINEIYNNSDYKSVLIEDCVLQVLRTKPTFPRDLEQIFPSELRRESRITVQKFLREGLVFVNDNFKLEVRNHNYV